MPTGYTYPVAEGKITTLREFALQCARGMGACIMMRDDPFDAPIPERFEPDTEFHDENLATAASALAELPTLSNEECERRALAAYDEAMVSHKKYVAEKEAQNRRIRAMQNAVEAWSTDAEGIKDFMLQQLGISIDTYEPNPPKKLTGQEWRAAELEKAARSFSYHERERARAIERTEDRNRWLAALRASLPES